MNKWVNGCFISLVIPINPKFESDFLQKKIYN